MDESDSPIKHLVYFDAWTDPVANQILAGSTDLEVVCLAANGDGAKNEAQLEQAHGYQAITLSEAIAAHAERWLPNADLINRCPSLLAVCTGGAGYDIVDIDACTAAGVIVCNQSGAGAEPVAEHALGFMLALSKKMVMADRALRRSADWQRFAFTGNDILGKAVGIVGFGQIGKRIGELCRGLFSMTVLAYDPYLDASEIEARGAHKVELDELLQRADFVSVSVPLTSSTSGMLGKREFALMKPTAFFITTARGGIHDEAALFEALAEERIAGAGIDVFTEEPPRPDHPLLGLENVIATPHVAGITEESLYNIAVAAAEQWLAIFRGERPPRLINPEAWPRYCERFERLFGSRPAQP